MKYGLVSNQDLSDLIYLQLEQVQVGYEFSKPFVTGSKQQNHWLDAPLERQTPRAKDLPSLLQPFIAGNARQHPHP